MNGPEEMAEHREYFDNRPDDLDDTYEEGDELLDIAEAKMLGWAMDKVLG